MIRSTFALIATWLMAVAAGAVLVIAAAGVARAHDAPTGWSYGIECCSLKDCSEVPADWIVEDAAGVHIVPTGEVIAYSDARLKQSKDEAFHWCRPPGVSNPKTICLYRPDRGV